MAQLGEELEEPDIGRTERRREENLRDGVGQWRCQIDAFWSDVGEWMGLGFILLEDNAIKLVGQNFWTKSRSPLHAEAESLMVRDWNYLDTLSKERLSQAISSRLGITQDFAQALLDRDTGKMKEYGKIELATAALSKLLGASDSGQNQNSNNSY